MVPHLHLKEWLEKALMEGNNFNILNTIFFSLCKKIVWFSPDQHH